jgi:hypothetical protein
LASHDFITLLESAFSFAIFTGLFVLSDALPHGVLTIQLLGYTTGLCALPFCFGYSLLNKGLPTRRPENRKCRERWPG